MVADGLVSECSFAFSDAADSWSDQKDERGTPYMLRSISACRLHDVSLVTKGAYGAATSAEARSLAYQFTRTGDVWAAERSALAALDARYDNELRARLAHIGEEIRRQAKE
jgi:phage head maturation protease